MKTISKVWRRCCGYAWQLKTRIYFTILVLLGRFPAPQPCCASASGNTIYLTFDDGPGGYTERLLGVLERYGVKATFFVTNTGKNIWKP